MPLRRLLALSLLLLPACGGGDDDDGDDGRDGGGGEEQDGGSVLGPDSFRLVTADVTIAPGDERTHCYYTSVPVDREIGVKRWSSVMTPGSHHMIMYALTSSPHPDGTIVEDCNVLGGGNLSSIPAWTFSAQTPTAQFDTPTGVGMTLEAGQKVVIEMHYLNASEAPIEAHVELTGEYYASDVDYTPASAFITYDTSINVPAMASGEAGGACDVPDDAKFFAMSTHAHKQATLTRVSDGDAMIFESDDWENPGTQLWMAEPFYSFGGELRYRCEYVNPTSRTINQGSSAETDEMCMAVGYFFPATKPTFCINDTILPL